MIAPKRTTLSPKVEVRRSAIEGRGLFALEPIAEGELVLEWGGEYVDGAKARAAEARGQLVMQWDRDLYSIEDRGEDDGYFINHSCDGDLWMVGPFRLVALRAIAAGDEVTADYALWEARKGYVSAWACLCGSTVCRGRVTGSDWQLAELQAAYRDHFSPLINARIAGL